MTAIWQRKQEGKKEREESLLNVGPLYFWALNFI
jgi:hypothetical protein